MIRPIRHLQSLTLLLACVAATHVHAQDSSTLEERMSYKDFTKFGLDKLSPEQLRGLNEWFGAHGGSCVGAAAGTPAVAPAPGAAVAAGSVTSRLVGDFRGWEKGTVLTLANGQRWEVRDDEPFHASRETAPSVTVDKALMGWTLSVAGQSEIAHVIPVGK